MGDWALHNALMAFVDSGQAATTDEANDSMGTRPLSASADAAPWHRFDPPAEPSFRPLVPTLRILVGFFGLGRCRRVDVRGDLGPGEAVDAEQEVNQLKGGQGGQGHRCAQGRESCVRRVGGGW